MVSSNSRKKMFEGIITPMLTPFSKKGEVDEKKLQDLVKFLTDNGGHGLFPISSTGECSSLTIEEKKRIIEIVLDSVVDTPVIPGTGSSSIQETIEMTQYAEKMGCEGVIIVTPYYLQPDQEGLKRYFSTVAHSVDLPIILYQIPSLTGVTIDPGTIVVLEEENENIIGLKDSSGDFAKLLEVKRKTSEDFRLFQGIDTLLLPSLLFGCAGGINGTTNVKPKIALQVYTHFEKGEVKKAKKIQLNKLTPLMNACMTGVFPAGFKAVSKKLGRNLGPPRYPIRPLKEKEEKKIEAILKNSVL